MISRPVCLRINVARMRTIKSDRRFAGVQTKAICISTCNKNNNCNVFIEDVCAHKRELVLINGELLPIRLAACLRFAISVLIAVSSLLVLAKISCDRDAACKKSYKLQEIDVRDTYVSGIE